MKRFKNKLIAAAVLSVLAIIGTMMNRQAAQAQGPPNGLAVNIVNPLPVPVTGTVGITGTQKVNVANPATAPVLALNVNDPGRIAYQSISPCTSQFETCGFQLPTVPTNHRLVIQHVSAFFFLPTNPIPKWALVQVSPTISAPGTSVSVSPVPVLSDATQPVAVVDQPVLVYAEGPTTPNVSFTAKGATLLQGSIAVSGYMLDCSIAPCAPIAP